MKSTSNQASRKRASLHTLGCRLNQSETVILTEKLQAAGYEIVAFGEPSDMGIINTCTVTREADAKSRKLIRSFIRKNPGAYVAVIGCYAQMAARAIAAIEGVDLIVGNQEKLNVLEYAAEGKQGQPLIVRDRIERDDFVIETAGDGEFTRRANLKIQDGCDFMCSFCVIPFARGRARSREMENLLVEARQLADRGAKELVLTGVNVGVYSHKGGDIVEVADRLNELPGLARIRISSIEPTTIPEALFERMADPNHRLVPYLHMPLQSGSAGVLKKMRRLYTPEAFLNFANEAHAKVPGIGMGTDIMVGMPGETESDFEETCAVFAQSPLFYAHVFKYSEREGTASVRFGGHVAEDDKTRRAARIRSLSAQKTEEFHRRSARTTAPVLFEQCEDGYWTGYTENYVRAAVRSDAILTNRIERVTLGESRGEIALGSLESQGSVEAAS